MELVINADSLRETLEDTPYSVEFSAISNGSLDRVISDARALHHRYQTLRQRLDSVIRNSPEVRALSTYQSNRLELQGPDLAETRRIIDNYEALSDLDVYHAITAVRAEPKIVDVLGLNQAHQLAETIASQFSSDRPFTVVDLRTLNEFCIPQSHWRGVVRTDDFVNIGEFADMRDPMWRAATPDNLVQVSWLEVHTHLRQICEYISRAHSCPPLAAAIAHTWFVHVHPFHDGNGRVARLIANLVMLRNGWPPIIARNNDREDYLDGLQKSDAAGDIWVVFELFLRWAHLTLRELEEPSFFQRLYKADLRQKVDRRVEEWTATAIEFTEQLRYFLRYRGTDFTVGPINEPSPATFVLLEERDGGAATLFARVRHPDGREMRIGLGYMSNQLIGSVGDATIDGEHISPTIFFQERDYSPGALYPYVHRDRSRFAIHEIAFRPGERKPCLLRFRPIDGTRKGAVSGVSVDLAADAVAKHLVDFDFTQNQK